MLEPAERRRLTKLAAAVKDAIQSLATIARPATLLRWIRLAEGQKPVKSTTATRKPGRPRTPEDVREAVLRIAKETG